MPHRTPPPPPLLSDRYTLLAEEAIIEETGLRNKILPGHQEANELTDIETLVCPLSWTYSF